MYGPKRPFLLICVFRDTRRIDFPQVDGWSSDTPGLGRHTYTPGSQNIFLSNKRSTILTC